MSAPTLKENDALDAARYRWLRDVGDSTWQPLVERSRLAFPHVPIKELPSMIDEIIDGAIEGGAMATIREGSD